MNTNFTTHLNCAPEDFPYDETALKAITDREMIIRTQWQLDLADRHTAAKEKGEFGTELPSHFLAIQELPKIIEGVIAVLNKLETKSARADKKYIEALASQPWLNFTAIAFTTIIDCAIKNTLAQTLIERIGQNCETEARWNHYHAEEPTLFNRIIEQQHKSGYDTDHISAVLTVAMNRAADGKYGDKTLRPHLRWQPWTDDYTRWLGNLLATIIINETGLFEYLVINVSSSKRNSESRLFTTERFDEFISKTTNRIGLYGGYYLPLPYPPRDWTSTQCGGFWTDYAGQKKLIKNWSKGYQEEMLNLSEQLSETVFPAINAAQHTAWRINHKVLDVLTTLRAENSTIANLPDKEDKPLPPCPKCGKIPEYGHKCFADPEQAEKDRKKAELERRKKAGEKINIKEEIESNKNPILKQWKARAADVHRHNTRLKSLRLAIDYGLDAIRIISGDERFYFVYQTDFRGRLYPCGQIHPQGTDWQKGLLQFADGVPLGKHGAKWLAVHLANTWGNDKVSFEERVKWVKDNEHWILDCAEHPLDNTHWADADEPFCFLAACFEWQGYKQQGEAYESRCAVALDGSCSGIQHYSAMLRDTVGALATNVICEDATKGKRDIYGEVAKATAALMQQEIADKENGKYAAFVLGNKLLNRKIVKRAVMTLPYGSKYQSCHSYISEALIPSLKALGKDEKECLEIARYTSKTVWTAIPLVVQAAREGMTYLQKLARLFSKQTNPITWQTPSGFMVQQSYYSVEGKRIKLLTGGNIVLKDNIPIWKTKNETEDEIRLIFQSTNTRKIDPTRQVSGIAPNFIHSLDASHLMMSVCEAKRHNISNFALIHDSLGTHAGHTEDFAKIIRETFYRLYSEYTPLEDITKHLLAQIEEPDKEKIPTPPTKGDLDLTKIKEAVYLFA